MKVNKYIKIMLIKFVQVGSAGTKKICQSPVIRLNQTFLRQHSMGI